MSASSAFADPPGIPFDLSNTTNRNFQVRSTANPCPEDPVTGFPSQCTNPLIWPDEPQAKFAQGSGVDFADFTTTPGFLHITGSPGMFGTEGAFASALGGYANQFGGSCTGLTPGNTCTQAGIVAGTGTGLDLLINLGTGKAVFSTEWSRVNLAVEIVAGSDVFTVIALILRSTSLAGDLVTPAGNDVNYYEILGGDPLVNPPIATSCQESALLGGANEPIECTLGLGAGAKVETGLVTTGSGDLTFLALGVVDNGLLNPSFVPLKFRFEEIWEAAPLPAVPTVLLPLLGLGLAVPAMWMVSRRR
jgi:hypothetical protein